MAAQLAPSARSAFARGEIAWESDDFLVVLAEPTYTYSTAHVFRSDVTDVLASASLAGMTVLDNGVCDALDCSVAGVAAADTVGVVLICQDTGSAATDRIIYVTNVHTDGTNIARVSDGNPLVVSWSNGPGRIFQI